MKRAIAVSVTTIAGTAAVLAYQPGSLFASTSAPGGQTSAGAQTFTGAAGQTQWGPVQVEVTVEGGKVTAVTALSYPQNDPKSSQISAVAIPSLEQQAMSAQSAQIDGVSGASYTSAAFAESLQSALTQAGL
jgi:uncharacterized protein with FMN-binding domain